jgi:DNA-binding HTH domain-containing proteins
MDTLARELGCDAAYFKLVSQPEGEVMAGVGGGMVDGSDRDYLHNYLATDVRVPRVALAARRAVLDDAQLISEDERRRSPFHNEWVPRYGLGHLLHVNIAQSLRHTAIVTCAQATARGEFDTRQRRLLALYVPHFERAVLLQLRLLELEQQATLMNDAFVHLSLPAMVLDGTARVIRANAAAQRALAGRDGIGVAQGRLSITDPEAAREVERRVREATFSLPDTARSDDTSRISVGRPSGLAPYRLELLPLPGRSSPGPAHRTALLAVLHDPLQPAGRPADELRRRFGLTPAEARLAQAIGQGSTTREYAEERGVSVGTARFQMKQVLAKTGCRRQSDLVRLIARGF